MPRTPKGDPPLDAMVGIRCTKEEREVYRAAAKAAGQTLSAWLKKLADDALRASRPTPRRKA